MSRKLYVIPALTAVIAMCWIGGSTALAGSKQSKDPGSGTRAIVTAANGFLKTLTADQRKTAQMDFARPATASATRFNMANMRRDTTGKPNGGHPPDRDSAGRSGPPPGNDQKKGPPASGEQYGKAVWSNFPINITPRPGIELGSLSPAQRAAAMQLLRLLLSPDGYQKIEDIMGSDQALADAGTDVTAGADHYLIGIFGTPDAVQPWMIEFGGHHLGLNIVVSGAQGTMTPTLTGAQPSVFQRNGKTIRVLSEENDQAFALLQSFDAKERQTAILNYKVGDLVLGPGHDGETIVPEGLRASQMTRNQKDKLIVLISQWAGIINDAYAKTRIDEIRTGIDETYFAWSGPTTHEPGKNGSAYYRIQGPHVIIEFAPQATFGDASVHVHTIYRDPLNSYGKGLAVQ